VDIEFPQNGPALLTAPTGRLDLAGLRRGIQAFLDSDSRRPGTPLLIDCRETAGIDIDFLGWCDLMGVFDPLADGDGPLRIAVVANPGNYGRCRQFCEVADGRPHLATRTFREAEPATAWLEGDGPGT